MRTFLVCTFLFFFIISTSYSQSEITKLFSYENHYHESTHLPYRFFLPEQADTSNLVPLVLTLHGSGERGTDNQSQVNNWRLATVWADPLNQEKYPCIVVSPQCPPEQFWSQNHIVLTLIDLVDSLSMVHNVDLNRLYVTGLSMGGYGTWELIRRYPKKFAAAIPMSGGGDVNSIETIKGTPIWNFHGAIDDVVPVEDSREMMTALENSNAIVRYTHCHYSDCERLPDSLLQTYIDAQENYIYTEYANGGHIIWDESYDFPFLLPWVFSKYLPQENIASLTNLDDFPIFSDETDIFWQPDSSGDSVMIWFSPDNKKNWIRLGTPFLNSGHYTFSTNEVPDCAYGMLRLLFINSEGNVIGRSESDFFTINNQGNAAPYLEIVSNDPRENQRIELQSLELEILAGDPETAQLHLNIFYSEDGGESYYQIDQILFTERVPTVRHISIDLAGLANSNSARLALDITDGEFTTREETNTFRKQNIRLTAGPVEQLSGEGSGIITVNVIDPEILNGQTYELTFNDSTETRKTYRVTNSTLDSVVLENIPVENNGKEGPYFDGMRLMIRDFDPPAPDPDHSGWLTGSSTLEISYMTPVINVGDETITGYPDPSDYELRIFESIVDTSAELYGAPPIPMKFQVHNLSDDYIVDIIFSDFDGDQTISRFDQIYFVEPDESGSGRITWSIFFGGEASDQDPQPGDVLLFKTYKPLTSEDRFLFSATLTSLQKPPGNTVGTFRMFPNFPNPFNPVTNIRFELYYSSKIELFIYNIQGQKIRRLAAGHYPAGQHILRWNGKNQFNNNVASGIYFAILKSDQHTLSRRLILIR